MRVSYGIGISAVLGLALVLTGVSSNAAAHKMASHKQAGLSPAAIAKAKQIVEAKHCNSCHGADLKGKPGFSPGLTSSGALKEYNPTTFAVVMDKGLDPQGHPVKKPMPVYHMSKADSTLLYTYFKSLK